MTTNTNAATATATATATAIHYYVDGLVHPHFTFTRRPDGKIDFAGNPGVVGADGEYGSPIPGVTDSLDSVMNLWVGAGRWRRQRVPEDSAREADIVATRDVVKKASFAEAMAEINEFAASAVAIEAFEARPCDPACPIGAALLRLGLDHEMILVVTRIDHRFGGDFEVQDRLHLAFPKAFVVPPARGLVFPPII